MPKEIFIVRNWITLQAAILNCSAAVVHSPLFSKISLENPSFGQIAATDYIPKWLHQECFLGNLPKAFGAPTHPLGR